MRDDEFYGFGVEVEIDGTTFVLVEEKAMDETVEEEEARRQRVEAAAARIRDLTPSDGPG